MTLGNPLRRMLLSSIEGTAVNWVRIEDIEHEYSTLPNIKEDVVDILLNIKAINLKSLSARPGKLRLEVEGPGEICAGDIMASSDFEIVNPEQHIATLDGVNSHLTVEMNIEQGLGYEMGTASVGLPIGVLPVDAIYTPVRKVNYTVERMRVGQHTDYERLLVEVWTNGAMTPTDAVRGAAEQLFDFFFKIKNFSENESQEGDRPAWAIMIDPAKYNMPVESLNLTARTLNCLKRVSIHKVGEILEKSRGELLRIRNFGEKSLEELDDRLSEIDIHHPEFGAADPAQADATTEEQEPEAVAVAAGSEDGEEE
jgi:DNA-directed RNA polymerase subunit alpha